MVFSRLALCQFKAIISYLFLIAVCRILSGQILNRTLQVLFTLFLVSLVSFTLMRALPGDPLEVMMGSTPRDMAPEDLKGLGTEMGLEESPASQYLAWLSAWVKPDKSSENLALGLSYRDGRPVKEVVGERIPATLTLVGLSLVLAFGIGLSLGALLTTLPEKLKEALEAALSLLYSMPNFWLSFLFVAILALYPALYKEPIFGLHSPGLENGSIFSSVPYLLAPAFILSLRRMAKVALYVRNLAGQELGKQYVLAALAKGLSRRQVVWRHVLKNCLLPVVNLLGLSLPALIGGSVLVETIFCVPGLGRLSVESAFARNYPVLLSLTMLYGTIVVLSSWLADLLSMSVDKRISEGA